MAEPTQVADTEATIAPKASPAMLSLWWQKADIVGKFFVGIVGLILSGVLAFGELADRTREQSRKADELARSKEESAVNQFQTYYGLARRADPKDEYAKTDLDIAGAIAQTLNEEFKKPFYQEAVITLRTRFAPSTSGGSANASAVRLQAAEASATRSVDRSTSEWFAVIATYSGNEEGRRLATERRQAFQNLGQLGCVEVWKTKITGQYAVVAGGKQERAAALAAAQRARQVGAAADAFTQANREWSPQVSCR